MSRTSRAFAASAVSAILISSVLLWIAAWYGPMGGSAAVAELSFPAFTDEREIVSALSSGGLSGIVSESTQWILINDFGEWEKVPLAEYGNRLEPFDPRNDGYADRLRSLFLTGNTRRVYLRRQPSFFSISSQTGFVRTIRSILEGKEYELRLLSSGSAPIFPLLLAACALAVALFASKTFSVLSALVPSFVLAAFGPGGVASAGFLCAFSVAFSRAMGEWGRADSPRLRTLRAFPWVSDHLIPAGLAAVASVAVAMVGGVPLVPSVLALLASVFAASAFSAGSRMVAARTNHVRFNPVSLRSPSSAGVAAVSLAVLPFALSSLVCVPAAFASPASASIEPSMVVDQSEYEEHLERQRSFMVTRLMDAPSEKGYTLFSVDADGFASLSERTAKTMQAPRSELPPVERLLVDLTGAPSRTTAAGLRSLFASLAAVLVSYPAFRSLAKSRRRAKAVAVDSEKRIAA
jgi:hypothetical protein